MKNSITILVFGLKKIIYKMFENIKNLFPIFEKNPNFSLDLKEYENCLKVCEGVEFVYNMACNMGGMGL